MDEHTLFEAGSVSKTVFAYAVMKLCEKGVLDLAVWHPGYKAFVLASAGRKAGYVILTNGDNGNSVIGQLANGDTPLNLLVTG